MIKLTDLIPTEQNKILNKLSAIKNYTKFVDELTKMAKKDDNLLSFIKSWKYYNNDKQLSINRCYIKATDLIPTQKELDLEKTLSNALSDLEQLHNLLQNKITLGIPIITFNGKYVIDGHHRWSQVMAFNPKDTEMECLNIESDAEINVKDILKIIQLAIYGETGELESKTVKSKNIYTISAKTIKSFINKNISQLAKQYYETQFKGNKADVTILKNIQKLKSKNKPIRGAVKREQMPQLDGNNQILNNIADLGNNFATIPK